MEISKKGKKLKQIADERKSITLLLDARKEENKITGVKFEGTLEYRDYFPIFEPNNRGYFFTSHLESENDGRYYFIRHQIRLFKRELFIKEIEGKDTLFSFNNSKIRGIEEYHKKRMVGEKGYGLKKEYINPRETFSENIVEIYLDKE